MPVGLPRITLRRRLLVATLAPAAAALVAFGGGIHEIARRTLDDELGRRLATAAAGVAGMVLPEQLLAIGAGDEASLTYSNLERRLEIARDRFAVRRVLIVAADLTGRGDTDRAVALGAIAHELGADRAEIERARAGAPSASLLFTGRDGRPYKRAYATIGPRGDVAGLAVVEGSAEYFQALASFRRWLVAGGAAALAALCAVVVAMAARITGPLGRLAAAAERIGRGELASPVKVEGGRDELALLAATLDEMREALRARDERTQMMLAGIAHEVRNPLGGIELYAGLLRDALATAPERLVEVARIEREIGHLKRVVGEFLDYARRPLLQLAPVPVRPLLAEVRDLCAAEAPTASITVEAPDGLLLRGDAAQLRRALLNLARNAAAATPAGGRIVLHAERSGGDVLLAVTDSGPGVAPDLRAKIFTPFFTTREKGTGLGLAFVHEIARDHGGEVTVGDAPGGGARFTLRLPAA